MRVTQEERDVAPLGLAMSTMQDSRVILDQNGAEELSPPGQAILARGTETMAVMTPYLPDDERASRLAALQAGEVELTGLERQVREAAARRLRQLGLLGKDQTIPVWKHTEIEAANCRGESKIGMKDEAQNEARRGSKPNLNSAGTTCWGPGCAAWSISPGWRSAGETQARAAARILARI